MMTYAAILAAFVVGVLLGRRTRPGRILPMLPDLPVSLWMETANGGMQRHEYTDGEIIHLLVPDTVRDITVLGRPPRDVYVAEASVPQYQG